MATPNSGAVALAEDALAPPGAQNGPGLPVHTGGPFRPGHPRFGGRQLGSPNRDRVLTIKRIMEMVDPIEGLAKIALGEPMLLAPAPGEPPTMVYPTIGDVRAALVALANKVMPDLKSIAMDGAAGVPVAVMIRIGRDADD
jgi:hypothetical protein